MIAAALALALAAARADPQAASDLAYALGEMHALTQICVGESDQSWRERMNRMLPLETPTASMTDPVRTALIERFNAGFALKRATHPACTPEAEADRQAAARRGLTLSRRLAGE
jgi:uncharacterized protein (TIGR02301 family)